VITVVYDLLMRAGRAALQLLARPDGKLGRGVAGRRQAVAQIEAWASAHRSPDRHLVWVHAPSVGEALMAGAIVRELRSRRPECQIAFTFFSSSAEHVAGAVGADVATYLPWDITRDVTRALAALQPQVVAFVRTEVWPTLARQAKRRGARVALLNAPLAPGSSRLRAPGRWLLRSTYRSLDAVGAVGPADAQRFADLGVPGSVLSVAGDARFDQVMARRRIGEPATIPAVLRAGTPSIVVAGSIWAADAERLVPAIRALRARAPLLWVLVPHEPTPVHVADLERTLDHHGVRHARIDRLERKGEGEGEYEAIVVDRVGMLADLYSIARVAYVGGGFGRDGLHAVIEPAACGVPVLFGPRHGNTVEAARLVEAGGGFIVRDAAGLVATLPALLNDRSAGEHARSFVEAGLGGSAANAAIIDRLLGGT